MLIRAESCLLQIGADSVLPSGCKQVGIMHPRSPGSQTSALAIGPLIRAGGRNCMASRWENAALILLSIVFFLLSIVLNGIGRNYHSETKIFRPIKVNMNSTLLARDVRHWGGEGHIWSQKTTHVNHNDRVGNHWRQCCYFHCALRPRVSKHVPDIKGQI